MVPKEGEMCPLECRSTEDAFTARQKKDKHLQSSSCCGRWRHHSQALGAPEPLQEHPHVRASVIYSPPTAQDVV